MLEEVCYTGNLLETTESISVGPGMANNAALATANVIQSSNDIVFSGSNPQ